MAPRRSTDCLIARVRRAVTFGALAKQQLQHIEEQASINGISDKWLRKQHAIVAVLCEQIGDDTPVGDIDFDTCKQLCSALARVPANKTKHYGQLPLGQVIARGAQEGKPTLSPTTQEVYLATFKAILDLAAKKRLICFNPAVNLRPLKRNNIADEDKWLPFTLEQLGQIFHSEYYLQCAAHAVAPYRADIEKGWRFWLPLIFLFSGMRPNEMCSLQVTDVRQTKAGTWYFDVNKGFDEDGNATKTLKTPSSKRRVPVHPELMELGLLQFLKQRQTQGAAAWLFPLKPNRDGNRAWYPLKRFGESYLRKMVELEERQSFYSFRHTVRDALRHIDAPDDALQFVTGWSQGKRVSDNYGEKCNPDYQIRWVEKIAYPGLDLSHLYMRRLESGSH